MSSLSKSIKQAALAQGFDVVGIARVHPQQPKPIAPSQPPGSFPSKSLLQHLRDWLSYEYHGTMEWMAKNPERRADLQKVLPECRSIISVGINYCCLLYTSPRQRD